jgi:hypothetical protein
MSETKPPAPEQERDEVSILITVLLIAGTLAVVVGSVFWAFGLFKGESPRPADVGVWLHAAAPTFGPDRIEGVRQTQIDEDRGEAWKRSQEEMLERYGWESREAGTVHIPIERAMELVLAGRVPPPVAAPSPTPPPRPREGRR